MNKRQAKIHALEDAAGILLASIGTLETDLDNQDHAKVQDALEQIAASLRNRVLRLRLHDRDKDIGAGR